MTFEVDDWIGPGVGMAGNISAILARSQVGARFFAIGDALSKA
jgi:hypothetical protein